MRKPSRRVLAIGSLTTLAVTSVAAAALGAGLQLPGQAATSGCAVTYAPGAQWQGGYVGSLVVRNLGEPVSNWRLTWTFPGGQRVVQVWGASGTQSGAAVTATSTSWNGTLGRGASASVGFIAAGPGQGAAPAGVALNGVACTGSAPAGSASAPKPTVTATAIPVTTPSTPPAPPPISSPAASPATSAAPPAAAGDGADCTKPAPLPVPAKHSVVGLGTTATCTESALRSAVAGGGYVTFDCGGGAVTISVTQEIKSTSTTVIDGGGKITLKGGGSNRILLAANGTTLSVRNLRFVNGAAQQVVDRAAGAGGAVSGIYKTRIEVIGSVFENNSAGFGGGAVYVGTDGVLTIDRSTFTGNSSWYGGAVYSLLSPLTVTNSTFTDNKTLNQGSAGDGGAIGTDGAAPLTPDRTGGEIRLCGSTFTHNTAARGSGGGAYLWAYAGDRVVVDRSTFKDNTIDGIGGGARVSVGPTDWGKTGSITITGTSVLSNTSTANGGGLYLDCAPTCTIENSTFYGNTSKAYGGAIFGAAGTHHDTNVTFADNHANGHGGALFGGSFVLDNTVFVGNSAGNPWGQAMSCASTGTGSHVIQWGTTSRDGSTSCIQQVTAVDPRLGKPADNGGPTLTLMPASGSPVIGAGSGCPARDQRGVARPGSGCDLGAVQVK
ncbi:MAG TPA: cellulose binding domain-containing protein [Kineosporiaceae bacterium]|nr:cellulose binding domain-containing protein [Kineosporiaceae bacterium]